MRCQLCIPSLAHLNCVQMCLAWSGLQTATHRSSEMNTVR